jgi:hypothetical protein
MTKVAAGAGRLLLRPPSRRFVCVLLGLYTAAGAYVVRDASGSPAVRWMDFYRFEDFGSAADAWRFFAELRTGIPPLLAALEVTEYLATGDAWLTDVLLYRAGMLLAFALPLVAFRRTGLECLASFGLCLLFLVCARIVGSPNPQIYDPLLPLFLIGPLLLLHAARRSPGRALPLAAAAGTGLALAELSRPFVLVLLPGLVAWGLLALRALPRRSLVAFLAPLVLLSGGWHAKLALAHDGQLFWSNHGGFNLYRAWEHEVVGWPEYAGKQLWIFESRARDGEFQGSGKFHSWGWNSQSHADRSQELTGALLRHLSREPASSARYAVGRVAELLRPKLRVGKGAPLGRLARPYRLFVRLAAAFLGANLLLLLLRLARGPRVESLASLEAAWILTACGLIVFLAVGDKGEEGRFVISVLPFLAALPRGWEPRFPAPTRGADSGGPSTTTPPG